LNKRKSIKEEEVLKLEKMVMTQEFLETKNILISIAGGFCEYFASNCASVAYTFMILSMILNAGCISLLYPLAVFGYALMEEERPGRHFWKSM
jgi:hypothetical protein